MRSNAKHIVVVLGLAVLTAGCVQDGSYPSTAYSYPNTGYSYPTAYTYPSTAYSAPRPAYVAPAAPRNGSYWNSARRDADRDGIPNRYDRDANGDGVADRYQGR
jgi:hypothetical protein